MDGAGRGRSQEPEAHAAAQRIDRLAGAPPVESRNRAEVSRSRSIGPLRTAPALLLLVMGCDGAGGGSRQPLLLDAMVAFPPRDTVRFSLPATTHRCADGRTVLLEAVNPEGSGVLARLHFRDSLVSGSYPVLAPGDTTTPGAVVAVRYLLRDASHGFFFDTGAVQVRLEAGRVARHIPRARTGNGHSTTTRLGYPDGPTPPSTHSTASRFPPV